MRTSCLQVGSENFQVGLGRFEARRSIVLMAVRAQIRDSALADCLFRPNPPLTPPDALRSYLTQTRTELALRLADRLYPYEQVLGADGQPTGETGPRATKPSKWWMSFQKRR